MVFHWDSFMSPTGGSMDNYFEIGMGSLAVDFGSSLLSKYMFEPLHNKDVMRLKSNYKDYLRGQDIVNAPSETMKGPTGATIKNKHHRDAVRDERTTRHAGSRKVFEKQLAGIHSKHKALKLGIRNIGRGYMFLAGAAIMESIVTPGLTINATTSNEMAMMGGETMLDSSQAYTQRQRALMAIHDSQLGARNVFGSEAALLHR